MTATEGGIAGMNGSVMLRNQRTTAEPVTPARIDSRTRGPMKRTTAR
jgi:hypothetical protein